jgi:Archaeal PaREP1/PaREP8 family.
VEEIVKRLRERGIDVEDVLIAALARQDPQESVKLRISLAERYMAECEKYLKEGDPVQASEKAYKAAEEVVKALAEKFGVPELQTALKEGRWWATFWARRPTPWRACWAAGSPMGGATPISYTYGDSTRRSWRSRT